AETVAGAPVIAVVPADDAPFSASTTQSPELRQAFDKLLANLRIRSFGRLMTSFAVTSPIHGDGRTSVAVGLALAFARAGHPVVLPDGDGGSAASALGVQDDKGLAEVLLGRAPL